MASRKRLLYWLAGSAIIITLLLLALPYLIDSNALKTRLQTAVEQQTGGQADYQQAEISLLPWPSITLHQVKLDIPAQVQGTVGSITVHPDLWPLLTGQVRLAKLILDSPELTLYLPDSRVGNKTKHEDFTFSTLQNDLAKGLGPLVKTVPGLALVINKGLLTFTQGKQTLGSVKDLNLRMDLNIVGLESLQANMQGSTSTLVLHSDGQKITIEDLEAKGSLGADDKKVSLTIDSLALAKPALQIKGDLTIGSASPAFELNLYGKGLDVDATRKTALALAGDTSPTKEIFDYLRGGTVPQISFHSKGKTASGLGKLKNIRIEGKLQDGAVSISDIKLDLTEVNGDVLIAGGVLEGKGVSTRLEGSSGHDGSLKVGLSKDSDLFQLELMLNADLPRALQILKRIVDNPAFSRELDKISNLAGTGSGKLVLGDSFADLQASVDIKDLNFSANYQGLPFPVGVSKGQMAFSGELIKLKDLDGTFGKSDFSGLTCDINIEKALAVNMSSGEFGLVLDELYPWVATFDNTKEYLKDIKEITGRLDLASLSIKGAVDAPEDWQLAANGAINNLAIEMSKTPAKMKLPEGDSSKGNVSIEEGPRLTLDVEYLSKQLQIKQLTVKDQHSDAKLAFVRNQDELSLDFTGALHNKTLESLFINQQFGNGLLKGDFNVKVPLSKQAVPVAKGHLEVTGLVFPLPSGEALEIEKMTMVADGTQVKADAASVSWSDFTWTPFNATIDFDQDKIDVRVTEAKLCGIESFGLLTIAGNNLSLDFTIEGKGLDVASSYSCLTDGRIKMTGTLDFSSKVSAQGQAGELIKSLQGPLEMTFTKGSIEQSKVLARTLEVLNVTEIVKGKLPNLDSTSFNYSIITMDGAFQGEKILINKLHMDAETLDVLGHGEIDFEQETVDVELLAAPFKTVDSIIKHIPGINYLLAGSLVTIPVSVKGNLADPKVHVMSVSSVGSGLLGLGERVIKSPFKLIETIVPEKKQ